MKKRTTRSTGGPARLLPLFLFIGALPLITLWVSAMGLDPDPWKGFPRG